MVEAPEVLPVERVEEIRCYRDPCTANCGEVLPQPQIDVLEHRGVEPARNERALGRTGVVVEPVAHVCFHAAPGSDQSTKLDAVGKRYVQHPIRYTVMALVVPRL